ncbi:unnamed protein product [Chrysoparadoxa australica]
MLMCKTLIHTTEVAMDQPEPAWEKSHFQFEILHNGKPSELQGGMVLFAVYDWQESGKHRFAGQAMLAISDLLQSMQFVQNRDHSLRGGVAGELPLTNRAGELLGTNAYIKVSCSVLLPEAELPLADDGPAVPKAGLASRGDGRSSTKGKEDEAQRPPRPKASCKARAPPASGASRGRSGGRRARAASSMARRKLAPILAENPRLASRIAAIKGEKNGGYGASSLSQAAAPQSSRDKRAEASLAYVDRDALAAKAAALSKEVCDLRELVSGLRGRASRDESVRQRADRAVAALEREVRRVAGPKVPTTGEGAGPPAEVDSSPPELKDLENLHQVLMGKQRELARRIHNLKGKEERDRRELASVQDGLEWARDRQSIARARVKTRIRPGCNVDRVVIDTIDEAQAASLDLRARIQAFQLRESMAGSSHGGEAAGALLMVDELRQRLKAKREKLELVEYERDACRSIYEEWVGVGQKERLKESLSALQQAGLFLKREREVAALGRAAAATGIHAIKRAFDEERLAEDPILKGYL